MSHQNLSLMNTEFENYFMSFLCTRSIIISEIQKEIKDKYIISIAKLELIYDVLYANSKIDKSKKDVTKDVTDNFTISKKDFWNCLLLLDFPPTKIKNYKVNDNLTLYDAIIVTVVLLAKNLITI